MFLIMSGEFVGQEMESEFGSIPPSFLPLGNRPLYQYQVALAPHEEQVYISLPESFILSSTDQYWLEKHHVTIIAAPHGLSLGASLVDAINISGNSLNTPLHILYGDTLFNQLVEGNDIVSVSIAKDSYNWAVVTNNKVNWLQDYNAPKNHKTQLIIDGYFKFSQPRELIRCITQCKSNFIDGLNNYHRSVGLTAVKSIGWLDFGHVNTYYISKADFTTARSFNKLTITTNYIEKTSSDNQKISAEASWFENIPIFMRGFIPQYLGRRNKDGVISYRLEYLFLTALNELFVFSNLSTMTWKKIIKNVIQFLSLCLEQSVDPYISINTFDSLFKNKTTVRLNEFCLSRKITLEENWYYSGRNVSLAEILNDSQKFLPNGPPLLGVLHGDLCFSNILYDFRANKIKIIDPRGITPEGQQTIYGDVRYDIAKMSHSILGLYDLIIAGYHRVKICDKVIEFKIDEKDHHTVIQQDFIKIVEETFGLTSKNLYAMQIQIFLSMLPLHADNPKRQDALFANAFRLHKILLELNQ
jgi:hypothetical protein